MAEQVARKGRAKEATLAVAGTLRPLATKRKRTPQMGVLFCAFAAGY